MCRPWWVLPDQCAGFNDRRRTHHPALGTISTPVHEPRHKFLNSSQLFRVTKHKVHGRPGRSARAWQVVVGLNKTERRICAYEFPEDCRMAGTENDENTVARFRESPEIRERPNVSFIPFRQ